MKNNPQLKRSVKPRDDMKWADHAACIDTPIELWFQDFGNHFDVTALRICRSCKVRTDCRDYAIERELDDGIWGGMTPKQRRTFSRRSKARK